MAVRIHAVRAAELAGRASLMLSRDGLGVAYLALLLVHWSCWIVLAPIEWFLRHVVVDRLGRVVVLYINIPSSVGDRRE